MNQQAAGFALAPTKWCASRYECLHVFILFIECFVVVEKNIICALTHRIFGIDYSAKVVQFPMNVSHVGTGDTVPIVHANLHPVAGVRFVAKCTGV